MLEKQSTSKEVQQKKSTTIKPYVVLVILGVDREEMNYNSDFLEDEITNIDIMEGEDEERIRRVIKKARNENSQATTTY